MEIYNTFILEPNKDYDYKKLIDFLIQLNIKNHEVNFSNNNCFIRTNKRIKTKLEKFFKNKISYLKTNKEYWYNIKLFNNQNIKNDNFINYIKTNAKKLSKKILLFILVILI